MKEEIKPLFANAHANMVGQVGSPAAQSRAPGWADVPHGESQAAKGNYASSQNYQSWGCGGRGGRLVPMEETLFAAAASVFPQGANA